MPEKRALAHTRARRWLIAGAVAAVLAHALVAARVIARIGTAPGVAATCTKLLELAELAGESTDDADRSSCEDRYTHVRAQLGLLDWAALSWCLHGARTISDAGGCA